MSPEKPAAVTVLLRRWRQGDEAAFGEVAAILDRELRRLARSYLRREHAAQTLQPTALVNEAYVRLIGQNNALNWESHSHFVAVAARHMRQILVDHARHHLAAKRGGRIAAVPLEDASAHSDPRSADLLALDEALSKLAAFDPRKAQALELKYFGGLETKEIAAALGIAEKTAEKDVRLASSWLRCALA